MYVGALCTHLVLGTELFRISLFVVEKLGLNSAKQAKIRKTEVQKYANGREGLGNTVRDLLPVSTMFSQ